MRKLRQNTVRKQTGGQTNSVDEITKHDDQRIKQFRETTPETRSCAPAFCINISHFIGFNASGGNLCQSSAGQRKSFLGSRKGEHNKTILFRRSQLCY